MRVAALALTATLAVATTTPAAAKEGVGGDPPQFGENAPRNYESSQWFNFEIKFGPYSPNLDASSGIVKGSHPFRDVFPEGGSGKNPPGKLLTQLELDFQFLHKWYGNFGIGHTIGYYRRYSHALNYIGNPTDMISCNNTPEKPCTASSGDTTSLNVIPLSLLFVYRFDYLAHRYKIPFVPYFKAGLAYYAWWIENGNGFLSIAKYSYTDAKGVAHQDSGYGGTWGFVLNPGGAFLLDVLDPSAARTLDAELGINHTYLFCELHYANITGFGSSTSMNLSDVTLNAGLSFEF